MTRNSNTRERLLEAIISFMDERGFPPSIRDIKRGAGLKSESTVDYHLRILEGEGRIERLPGIARGIRIPGHVRSLYSIVYKCLYPFGCKTEKPKPGECRYHGTELVPFVTKK